MEFRSEKARQVYQQLRNEQAKVWCAEQDARNRYARAERKREKKAAKRSLRARTLSHQPSLWREWLQRLEREP